MCDFGAGGDSYGSKQGSGGSYGDDSYGSKQSSGGSYGDDSYGSSGRTGGGLGQDSCQHTSIKVSNFLQAPTTHMAAQTQLAARLPAATTNM